MHLMLDGRRMKEDKILYIYIHAPTYSVCIKYVYIIYMCLYEITKKYWLLL